MRVTETHTYSILEVSQSTYDEIKKSLEDAGYDWVFHENNIIDMHGIALQLTEHTEES